MELSKHIALNLSLLFSLITLLLVLACQVSFTQALGVTCTTNDGKPSGFLNDTCTGNFRHTDSCADADLDSGYKVLECNKTGTGLCDSHFNDVVVSYMWKCVTTEDCASKHLECVEDVCDFKRRAGDPCISDGQCAYDSTCNVDTNVCTALGENDMCEPDNEKKQCKKGYYCKYRDGEGMDEEKGWYCHQQKQPGQACEDENSCRYGKCLNATTGENVCPQKRPEAGEECNDSVEAMECVPGLFCNANSTCEYWRGEGEQCANNTQCKDQFTCYSNVCTANELLTCHDDTTEYECQGGCNCVNGTDVEGTCAGGEDACLRTYKAMRYCEEQNCLIYDAFHYYPFDMKGCFQRECKFQVDEYYTCQVKFFKALGKRFPDLPFYNWEFPEDSPAPPPQEPSTPGEGDTSGSIRFTALTPPQFVGVTLMAMALLL